MSNFRPGLLVTEGVSGMASHEPTRVRFYTQLYAGGQRRVFTGTVTEVWRMGTKFPRYVVNLTDVRTLGGRRIERDFRVWIEDVIGTL